jgi:alkylation response protein AidB-like acyl-CoA dehydrogenase
MRFKMFAIFGLIMAATMALPTHANALGFGKEPFQKEIYVSAAGGGSKSGMSKSNPMALATNAAMWAIPANTLINKVYVVIDSAITGSSAVNIGDDDSSNGYVPTAALTLGTPGMYGWDAKGAGSYLRIQTAGATDAGDIYVVPNAKYYSAAGKHLTMAVTGAATGGTMRVVVEGMNIGL